MKVLIIQHIPVETPGIISDILKSRDIEPIHLKTHNGQPIPKRMDNADGLIVMGGPMSVRDKANYLHISDEIELVRHLIKEEKPILGICLGAQILAASLGAKVFPGKEKEIGWHNVKLTENASNDPLWKDVDKSFTPLHWHGDQFDLPPGATRLASSVITSNQAFRFGDNAYGILFHLEMTRAMISDMANTFADDVRSEGLMHIDIAGLDVLEKYYNDMNRIGNIVFGNWIKLVLNIKKSK